MEECWIWLIIRKNKNNGWKNELIIKIIKEIIRLIIKTLKRKVRIKIITRAIN